MSIYNIKNLSFQYKKDQQFLLNNISFTIDKGQFYLLCGKSGSGKTTLLQLLKKEMRPHGYLKGHIYMDTYQPHEIGYIMQNPDFQIVCHKVIHELSFGLENMGMPLLQMKRRIGEVVHFFNLQSILHKEITELSGGQKQLVNLASIVAMQPKIMLLDEPTAQLDPIASKEFLTMLKRINEELDITIIMVEHDVEQTMNMCDTVIYLEDGNLEYFGSPAMIPYLEKFEKALPVVAQLFHNSGIQEISYDLKKARQWIKENKEKFVIAKNDYCKQQDVYLQIQNIHFHYHDLEVLKGLDLTVYKNEILAIVGGNGSGKSTLLKVLCGLLKYQRGKIVIDNTEIKNIKNPFENCLAYLPQDPTTMFLKETVREELNNQESIEWLHELGLDFLLEQHPYDLSGGQMQLLAFIKILALHPRCMLLDEPTKGLDAYYKEKMGILLKKLAKEITIIVVSHDLEFCGHYANRVGMMFEGKIEAIEDTHTFFNTNLFYTTIMTKLTRGIIDGVNVLEDIFYE